MTNRSKLTKRQREVLAALTKGLSNKEIARILDIAEATTKIHVAGLLRNLGVRNRVEAVFKAGRSEHDNEHEERSYDAHHNRCGINRGMLGDGASAATPAECRLGDPQRIAYARRGFARWPRAHPLRRS